MSNAKQAMVRWPLLAEKKTEMRVQWHTTFEREGGREIKKHHMSELSPGRYQRSGSWNWSDLQNAMIYPSGASATLRPMTSRSPMNKNIVGPQEMTNLMNSHNLQCQLFALSSVPASGSRHQLFWRKQYFSGETDVNMGWWWTNGGSLGPKISHVVPNYAQAVIRDRRYNISKLCLFFVCFT